MANTSFLENENQMLIDATLSEIGEELVEDWINSNLDEGQLYADWCSADRSGSNQLKGRFKQHLDLNPTDNYYLEWNQEL